MTIHSNSRYFNFLNGLVVKHALWLWEACMGHGHRILVQTVPSPEPGSCGQAGLPEAQSMLNHKPVEETKISGN